MAIKSLLISSKFGQVKREHVCQANKKHVLRKGDNRFEVKNGRNWDKYCLECAEKILNKADSDLEKLMEYSKKRIV